MFSTEALENNADHIPAKNQQQENKNEEVIHGGCWFDIKDTFIFLLIYPCFPLSPFQLPLVFDAVSIQFARSRF